MVKCMWCIIALLLITICLGCSKTKTTDILSDSKMNIGQQVSCIYAENNLYCGGSQTIKPEDIEPLGIMNRVVFVVRSMAKNRSDADKVGEAGTYPTKFAAKPQDYSLWNCNKTGIADPAVTCTLLRNPDSKQIAQQLELAKFRDSVVRVSTEKTLLAACGNPLTTKSNSISKTFVYPTTQPGVFAEVRFSTLSHDTEPTIDEISTVDEKTGKFWVNGILWFPSTEDGDRIGSIKKYLPCLK